MVLNWFTQGVMVAVVAAAALYVMPRSRAQARYAVAWTALLLVAGLPAVPELFANAADAPRFDFATTGGPPVTMPATWWTSSEAAVGLLVVAACLHAIVLAAGALGVRNARRGSSPCAADVLVRLPHWSRLSASGRRARVIVSSHVRAAAVLGGGTPAIAVAPGLIQQLSDEDLDRVLVHEWAHVQRRDDIAQLAQRVLRLAIGWHPAAWWLERQLEFEREAACDELVVSITGSPKGYAACLTALAALPPPHRGPLFSLGAAGPWRLRERVIRILAMSRIATRRPWRAMTVCGGIGLLACTAAVANVQLVTAAVSISSIASAQTAAPALISVLPASHSTDPNDRASNPAGQMRASEKPRSARTEQRSLNSNGIDQNTEPPVTASPFTPSPASAPAVGTLASAPLQPDAPEPFAETASESAAAEPAATDAARAVWTQAADAGLGLGHASRELGTATGRASRNAGTATGRFFTRLGKKIAGAF
jgi:beta-lactamase regulating signal transducer with metallopeptidase domain